MQDGPRADEPDPGQDLRGDPGWVAPALRQRERQCGEERRAHADQNVGTQARGLPADLALQTNGAPEQHRERELQQ